MYPYWILGILVMLAVISSGNANLIRIDKTALKKWILFLACVTVWRVLMTKLLHFNGLGYSKLLGPPLPVLTAFTVFWEDACHGLPLLILRKLVAGKKWLKPLYYLALSAVMIEFGIGHLYQGVLAGFILALYIPYSIDKGEQYGFGTVMLGHMAYDLVTLLYAMWLYTLK